MSVETGSEEVQSLNARLEELEAEVRSLRGDGRRGRRRRKQSVDVLEAPERVSRRRMLGMLKGAAAAGAGLAVVGTSNNAFADAVSVGTADGDALQIGGANTCSATVTQLSGSLNSFNPIFKVTNNSTSDLAHVFQAIQSSTDGDITGGTAVLGLASAAAARGVVGIHSSIGVGVAATSFEGAALRVVDSDDEDFWSGAPTVPMPPTTGTWSTGSLVNSAGQLWYCYLAGIGSASKWARLSSPFVPVTPTRVYDSRVGAPLPTGVLLAGSNRTISVAHGRDGAGAIAVSDLVPAGATAVTANVTVTGTTSGFGYLAINPGGNTVEGASTINWFGAGQTIANGVTLTLNGARELTVICNGAAGASTQFIVDVSGYYL